VKKCKPLPTAAAVVGHSDGERRWDVEAGGAKRGSALVVECGLDVI